MYLVENPSSKQDVRPSTRKAVPRVQPGLFLRVLDTIVTAFAGAWGGNRNAGSRHLRLVETLSIGPKKQMLLIQCDGEKYLVATGPESVQAILRIEPRTRAISAGNVPVELGERS